MSRLMLTYIILPYITKEYYNVIDIETFGTETLVPYCCVIMYKAKMYVTYGLDCIDKMIKILFVICDNMSVLFAHNLTFDGCLIIKHLPNNVSFSNKNLLLNGSIYSLSLKCDNKTIIFKCSHKFLPMRLSDISDRFNLSNKINFDHKQVCVSNFLSLKDVVIEYCKRDVEITNKFLTLIGFSLINHYPSWRFEVYGVSGLAIKLYKSYFMKKNINARLSLNSDKDRIVRHAYYGGRCEVFGNSSDDDYQYHYDFTGMYTSMLNGVFPIDDGVLVETVLDHNKFGFYSVDVFSDLDLPVLPYRCPMTKKLLFPNGSFTAVYFKEELDTFVKSGGVVKKYNWGFVFNNLNEPFKEFSSYCAKNRLKSKIDKVMWKLIPNSFIGRLGLKPSKDKTEILRIENYNIDKYDVI
jgi:hypothetical protein